MQVWFDMRSPCLLFIVDRETNCASNQVRQEKRLKHNLRPCPYRGAPGSAHEKPERRETRKDGLKLKHPDEAGGQQDGRISLNPAELPKHGPPGNQRNHVGPQERMR